MLSKLTEEQLTYVSDEILSLREMFKNCKDYYLDFNTNEIVLYRLYMYSKHKLAIEDDGVNSNIIKIINDRIARRNNNMLCGIDENSIEDANGDTQFDSFTASVRHLYFNKFNQAIGSYRKAINFNLETAREIVPLIHEYLNNNKILYAIDYFPGILQRNSYVKHLIAKAQSDFAELQQIVSVINS